MGRLRTGIILVIAMMAAMDTALADEPRVSYDAVNDRLSIDARDSSLRGVLREVARQTGVDIQLDPAAERSVTYQLKDRSLVDAMQQLLAGMNSAFIYSRAAVGRPQALLGVEVMASGEGSGLRPVLSAAEQAEGQHPRTRPGALGKGSGQPASGTLSGGGHGPFGGGGSHRLATIEQQQLLREKRKLAAEAMREQRDKEREAREQALAVRDPQRAALRQSRRQGLGFHGNSSIKISPVVINE